MKKIYSKPEIIANAYAEFENVMTFACTKVSAPGCHFHPNLDPGGSKKEPEKYDYCDPLNPIKLTGQSDFKTTIIHS